LSAFTPHDLSSPSALRGARLSSARVYNCVSRISATRCIIKPAEGQASEQTLMAIAALVSRKMLEHYSHARMVAKRAAVDAIAKPVFEVDVAQNWAQSPSVEKTAAPN
jgi:hypothetical protein